MLATATRDASARRLLVNVGIAFLPLAVLGLLFGKALKAGLFNAPTVAAAFIIGGFIILWAERRGHTVRIETVEQMTMLDALKVGLAQALALDPRHQPLRCHDHRRHVVWPVAPGGDRIHLLSRNSHARRGVAVLALQGTRPARVDDLGIWVVGMVAAFVSAFACVRWLLRYVATHTFVPFAWYRIAFGVLVLLTAWSGVIDWAG